MSRITSLLIIVTTLITNQIICQRNSKVDKFLQMISVKYDKNSPFNSVKESPIGQVSLTEAFSKETLEQLLAQFYLVGRKDKFGNQLANEGHKLDKAIISNFLPEGLLTHFRIVEVLQLGDVVSKKLYIEIKLEENNEILGDYDKSQYESKGFTEITLQDFPIRGKQVYLRIKRRRWRHKQRLNEIIRNDFSFVAEGSGFTKELSDFLKGTGRYKGRYNNKHR